MQKQSNWCSKTKMQNNRISYLVNYDIHIEDGVTRKIIDQMKIWNESGFSVKLFSIENDISNKVNNNFMRYIRKSFFSERFILKNDMIKDIIEFNPGLIYFRNDNWSLTYEYLAKKFRFVIELNSIPSHEYLLYFKSGLKIKFLAKYLFSRLFNGRLYRNIKSVISVTHEIDSWARFNFKNAKFKVIPNSIDINHNNFRQAKFGGNHLLRKSIFFIGSPDQPWHGTDIIYMIAEAMPDVDFHLVGDGYGNRLPNIFHYGYLNRDAYQKILDQCTICIGTLGLFRRKSREACPLKTREYLANHKRCIIGYTDTAFINIKEVDKIILELDFEDDKNFHSNINLIKNFINKDELNLEKDFELIKSRIASSNVESARADFLKSVIN